MAKKKENVTNVTNDAAPDIASGEPYIVEVAITGTAPYLFHRWSCDAVAEKAAAKKGSAAKKTDNVESYVYRSHEGELAIPGEAFRQSIIHSAKFRQDPRSPRKSAMDLYKAGVVALTELCLLNANDWDYIDRRRVVIQRSAITRERPAMKAGWSCRLHIMVLTPEYIATSDLHDVLTNAGRLVGVGDFRPTFGRFRVDNFALMPRETKEAAE